MKRLTAQTDDKENFYRCPACGEMVDKRQRASVFQHHSHVLHPRLDSFVTLPVPRPAEAGRVGASPSALSQPR